MSLWVPHARCPLVSARSPIPIRCPLLAPKPQTLALPHPLSLKTKMRNSNAARLHAREGAARGWHGYVRSSAVAGGTSLTPEFSLDDDETLPLRLRARDCHVRSQPNRTISTITKTIAGPTTHTSEVTRGPMPSNMWSVVGLE